MRKRNDQMLSGWIRIDTRLSVTHSLKLHTAGSVFNGAAYISYFPNRRFPMAIVTDCPKEVDFSEAGPIGIAEVVFGIGTLPKHKATEPNLRRWFG